MTPFSYCRMKGLLTRCFALPHLSLILSAKLATALQYYDFSSRQVSSSAQRCHATNRRPIDLENPFVQCWAADSWTVDAAHNQEINDLVRCFCSPAPPAYFALKRALEQNPASRHYEIFRIFTRTLKKGFYFVVNVSSAADDTTTTAINQWKIMGNREKLAALEHGWEIVPAMEPFSSPVQIAHHLLDLATEASERHERIDPSTLNAFADLALERLDITLGTESRGRSSADAAFAFAMAGVTRPELYRSLSIISYLEIDRMGPRQSLPSMNILQIVEKLAAAGIQGPDLEPICELAARLLSSKKDRPDSATIGALRNDGEQGRTFGLHSTRSLLWLWRFAARQSKAKAPKAQENQQLIEESDSPASQVVSKSLGDADWVHQFDNPSKPLVVDIGCGMGVSVLGLSSNEHLRDKTGVLSLDYSGCNFLGGDLKSLSVGYGNGIASRWGLGGNTRFVHISAEDMLDQIRDQYTGPVVLIMIQFPTPFRLATKTADDGNKQLPTDASSGFMVTRSLLEKARDLLAKSTSNAIQGQQSFLLLQSNCEDVAVAMRDLALQVGLECVSAENPVKMLPNDSDTLPQRTVEWIKAGGERPIGDEWFSEAILPRYGQTETEVSCEFNGTPVHRCLLRVT